MPSVYLQWDTKRSGHDTQYDTQLINTTKTHLEHCCKQYCCKKRTKQSCKHSISTAKRTQRWCRMKLTLGSQSLHHHACVVVVECFHFTAGVSEDGVLVGCTGGKCEWACLTSITSGRASRGWHFPAQASNTT